MAKKKTSAITRYLTKDSSYQRTLRDLNRALADYNARLKVERTRAGTEFNYAKRQLGQQRTLDLSDMKDDFAARGIVRSGVYANRVGEYNTQFNDQVGNLSRAYSNQVSDFSSGLREFKTAQRSQLEAAREAAIRRRAAKLGLT